MRGYFKKGGGQPSLFLLECGRGFIMSRGITLNLSRNRVDLRDLKNRLVGNKFKTGQTRTRNKVMRAIELAYELIKSGELKPEIPVEMVTNAQRLFDYMDVIKKNGKYVLDLETTGLSLFDDIIVGVCLYTPNENPIYIPVNHTNVDNKRLEGQLNEQVVRDLLMMIITNSELKCIGHNIKFDAKFIKWHWGYDIGNIYWDTQIAGHLLNENESHGLKQLYAKYIKRDKDAGKDYGDYFGDSTPFNYIPLEVATIYGANDVYKNYKLYEFQKQYIDLNGKREDMRKIAKIFFNIEMMLVPILINMELRGIEIREDYSKALFEEFKERIERTERELDELVMPVKDLIMRNKELSRLTEGGKLNYNSPKQLTIFLYDVLKLTPVDKKNPRGTGEGILLKLKSKNKEAEQFIDKLLEYRELNKLFNTYVDKIPRVVEEKTGAVHSNFNQTGTVTGRFSSSHPVYRLNLQNIPARSEDGKRIRRMFKAREGYLLLSADYSQIEPRVLASISGDIDMREAYEKGQDLYSMMASRIYQVPYNECLEFNPETGEVQPEGKRRRDNTKSVLLGLMYDRGAKSIAEQFGESVQWAEELMDNFFHNFPKIKLTRERIIHQAEVYGYVNTILGRKRRLPDMKRDKDDWRYINASRQCVNSVIQGTAGDIMKMAMVRIGQNERLKELDAHLLMTIHDEVIIELPEENAREVRDIIVKIMKETGTEITGMPMKVDTELTKFWYGEDLTKEYIKEDEV